jgi:2-amino-4-hydroxy-6-hydroxymethyldihydropteridine diphosphokinase
MEDHLLWMLIFFWDHVINKNFLIIPHKEVINRLFVLVSLCKINCNFKHPVLKCKIKDILCEKFINT